MREPGSAPDNPPSAAHPVPEDQRATASASGLQGRVFEAVVALSTSAAVGQLANVAATLLLARILAPADFGAIGVAVLVINTLTLLRNAFVFQTLMHRAEQVREAADQMLLISLVVGVTLCTSAWLGADRIAVFFRAPSSTLILRLILVAFLIGSIGTIPDTLFEKELRFRRKMWLEATRPVTVAAVSVALAALGAGAAAVGWGEVAAASTWTLGLYWISEYRPRLSWNPRLLRQLLSYGGYVFAGSVLVVLFSNLDNASIARVLGGHALGYYSFAFLLAYFPAQAITGGIISSILLPVYSRYQHDRAAQARTLLAALRYVTYYSAPLTVAIIVLGPVLLRLVYGAKWAPMFTVLQVLAVYGFAHSYFLVARNLCNGVGRARPFWGITCLQVVLVVPLLVYAPQHYGITGTGVLFTAGKVIATLVALAYAVRFTGLPVRQVIRPLSLPVALSLLAGLAAFGVTYLMPGASGGRHVVTAGLGIVVFAAVYLTACVVVDPALLAEGNKLLTHSRRTRRGAVPATPGHAAH